MIGERELVLYLVFIAVLVLMGPKNSFRLKGIHEDYISRDNTDAVRGIFILLILASHFCNPLAPFTGRADTSYWAVRVFLGQLVVAPFLFYSGYGMTEAIRRKGSAYVRAIPRTRILRILVIYGLIQVCLIILNVKLKRTLPPLGQVFLAIASIGSDNWYIFDIIMCYLITWIAYLLFPEKEKSAVSLASFLCIGLMSYYYSKKYAWHWYNTLLCYPFGMWYSLYRDKIERVCKNDFAYLIILFAGGALFYLAYLNRSRVLFYELHACLFALLLVLIGMKFTAGNVFLRWCGKNLMSLFLVHRIPFQIVSGLNLINNMHLRFLVFWVSSMVLAIGFSRVVKGINESPVFKIRKLQ